MLDGASVAIHPQAIERWGIPQVWLKLVIQKIKRVRGIEPLSLAWKAKVLPLNYTRRLRVINHNYILHHNTTTWKTQVSNLRLFAICFNHNANNHLAFWWNNTVFGGTRCKSGISENLVDNF